MKFVINIRALAAANIFAASSKEYRYYLQGVNVRRSGDEHIILEATDGYRLVALRYALEIDAETDFVGFKSFVIPSSLISRIKLHKIIDLGTIEVSTDMRITIHYVGTFYSESAIDCNYPDTRRLAPQTVDGILAQFKPKYLASFIKAGKLFNSKQETITVSHNGIGPALVNWVQDAKKTVEGFGVIMPIRTSEALTSSPHWMDLQPSEMPMAAE
jgi:DNA polymerase III sliding clamp (beta) subunit (PCNA family)